MHTSGMDRETYELLGRIGRGESIETRPFIQTRTDAELEARRVYLQGLWDLDDDSLSGTGYAELRQIEQEQRLRAGQEDGSSDVTVA